MFAALCHPFHLFIACDSVEHHVQRGLLNEQLSLAWRADIGHLIALCNLAELIRKHYILQNVLPPFWQRIRRFCNVPYVPCQQSSLFELERWRLPPQCHFKYIACTGLLSTFPWLCNHRYIIYSSVQGVCVYMHVRTYICIYYVARSVSDV